jgi:hypothetical protein
MQHPAGQFEAKLTQILWSVAAQYFNYFNHF